MVLNHTTDLQRVEWTSGLSDGSYIVLWWLSTKLSSRTHEPTMDIAMTLRRGLGRVVIVHCTMLVQHAAASHTMAIHIIARPSGISSM